MTFNVRGAGFPDGVNSWERRRELNIETIRRHSPDFTGLQEAEPANLAAYRAELNEYACFEGTRYGSEQPGQYAALLWKTERFSLLACGGFWLGPDPDAPERGWTPRSCAPRPGSGWRASTRGCGSCISTHTWTTSGSKPGSRAPGSSRAERWS
jgi:mRNA deadenylase 3'-5' endonuclease subunit Ccr4